MTLQTGAQDLLFRAWDLKQDFPALEQLLSGVPEEILLDEPELGFLLAQAQFYGGRWNEALKLIQLIEKPLRAGASEHISRRRINLEAMIRLSLGDAVTAESLLLEAVEASALADDPQVTAYARSNLGVVSDIQCRWDEALVHYQHAMAAYQNSGLKHGVGQVHHNTAMTYRQIGLFGSSATHFEHALGHFLASGVQVEIAGCENERAVLLIAVGDLRLAEATAQRALHRYSRIGHEPGVGDAHRVLGMVALRRGRTVEAGRFLSTALEATRNSGDRLTEAETLEEVAVLWATRGDADSAEAAQSRAAEIYRSFGAEARIRRMRGRLADI